NQPRGAESPARFDYAEIYYIEPNRPPRVKRVNVAQGTGAPRGGQRGPQPSPNGPQPPQPQAKNNPGEAPSEANSNQRTIMVNWEAEDPNEDELQYALYFRGADEARWKLIAEEISTTQQQLNVGLVADGPYRFRVVASDKLANPPGQGLEGE